MFKRESRRVFTIGTFGIRVNLCVPPVRSEEVRPVRGAGRGVVGWSRVPGVEGTGEVIDREYL